jgi:hypothetical protein
MYAATQLSQMARLAALTLIASGLAACGGNSSSTDTAATPATASTAPSAAPVQSATPVALGGSPGTAATVGQDYFFQPRLTQGSGTIVFSISGRPKWATFDSDTGVLTGTPGSADEGHSANISIAASNGSSSAALTPFSISVTAPPNATASATLMWAAPTENTDGTPVTALAGFHILYGTSSAELTQVINVADASTTSYVVHGLTSGTYYFAVTAYNSEGGTSANSTPIGKGI